MAIFGIVLILLRQIKVLVYEVTQFLILFAFRASSKNKIAFLFLLSQFLALDYIKASKAKIASVFFVRPLFALNYLSVIKAINRFKNILVSFCLIGATK